MKKAKRQKEWRGSQIDVIHPLYAPHSRALEILGSITGMGYGIRYVGLIRLRPDFSATTRVVLRFEAEPPCSYCGE